MAASANAHYVLRLVLGTRRALSTAVLRGAGVCAPSTSATAANSSLATSAPAPDFLEQESDEYDGAVAFLPRRVQHEAHPIPWPTIFTYGDKPKSHKPCDLIARLVAENRLPAARKTFDELRALHTPIEHRKVYLEAALSSLQPTPQGRADFLFWLGLFPNRPALWNNPSMKETWEPVVCKIVDEHMDEPRFVGDFLALAGRKGLLPAVLPPMISVLTAICSPTESERMMEQAIDAYVAACGSSRSISSRAKKHNSIVAKQVARWWNAYLRNLSILGWKDNARALLFSPPPGAQWSRITRAIVLGESPPQEKRLNQALLQHFRPDQSARQFESLLDSPAADQEKLCKRLRRALDSDKLPSISTLAQLQRQVRQLGEPLLAQFQERFCNSPTAFEGRSAPTVAETWWWHATIYRLGQEGEHVAALQTFREHFIWIGLAPTTIPAELFTPTSRRLPTVQVLTSIIPSILTLLPTVDREKWHQAYLHRLPSFPPALRPTQFTHLAMVRQLAHLDGPEGASKAVSLITDAGLDPGEAAWNALLLSLLGSAQLDPALNMLKGMEAGVVLNSKTGLRVPRPSGRTYAGLVQLATASDHPGRLHQASVLLAKFEDWCKRPEATAADKALLEGVKGDLIARQRGKTRHQPDIEEVERARKPSTAGAVASADRREAERAVG